MRAQRQHTGFRIECVAEFAHEERGHREVLVVGDRRRNVIRPVEVFAPGFQVTFGSDPSTRSTPIFPDVERRDDRDAGDHGHQQPKENAAEKLHANEKERVYPSASEVGRMERHAGDGGQDIAERSCTRCNKPQTVCRVE